jgi:hypothetical protein
MGRAAIRSGWLPGLPRVLAACLLAACGGGSAAPDVTATEPPPACLELASAYHSIAKNKDLGSSKERQLMLVRRVAFEDPAANVESLAFMEHVVEFVYRYPDEDAEAIRQRVLADCELDPDGEPVLRTLWDQR